MYKEAAVFTLSLTAIPHPLNIVPMLFVKWVIQSDQCIMPSSEHPAASMPLSLSPIAFTRWSSMVGCCAHIVSLKRRKCWRCSSSFSVLHTPHDNGSICPLPSFATMVGVMPGYLVSLKCAMSVIIHGMPCIRKLAAYGATKAHLLNLL